MAFCLDQVLELEPYSLQREEKRRLYTQALSELTRTHAEGCGEYGRILEVLGHDCAKDFAPEDQPMLPVRLFKRYELCSVQFQSGKSSFRCSWCRELFRESFD